jgi:tRNA pseudouridine55 synthase
MNVLKPPGMTSHDVVNRLRKLLGIKKIGHGGTLDPAAAGVLPVFIGKATKAIQFFEDYDKEYVAEMTLGVVTDTGDSTGNVVATREIRVDISKIKQVLKKFTGVIEQIPPMYSAVHYRGVKLYELARKGITVERKPRTVEIKSLEVLDFRGDRAIFKITCTKGTYIRTLCEDIGRELGCGAYLSCLVRTGSGPFGINNSLTLEEIEQYVLNNELDKIIKPIDSYLEGIPGIEISFNDEKLFSKGKVYSANQNQAKIKAGDLVRVYGNGHFLGIGEVLQRNQRTFVRIVKSFI